MTGGKEASEKKAAIQSDALSPSPPLPSPRPHPCSPPPPPPLPRGCPATGWGGLWESEAEVRGGVFGGLLRAFRESILEAVCPAHSGFHHNDRFSQLAGQVGPASLGTIPWKLCTGEIRLMSQNTQR